MDELAELLAEAYGLAVEQLEPAPRGWTGETFAVRVRGGRRVFVKLYPPALLPPNAEAALPVLTEMAAYGLREIAPPIRTRDGELSAWLGDELVVLFEHLEAERIRPFPFGGEDVGELIGGVHAATAGVSCPVATEAFDRPYAEELWRTLDAVARDTSDDEGRQRLRRWVLEKQTEHAELWARFDGTAQACREAGLEMVVTHGDWSFNLLRRPDGTTFLVDWDELLLAPPERDTWFANGDAAFWRGYRRVRPAIVESELATRFYVQNRYFEEVLGSARIVMLDAAEAHRLNALGLLSSEWTKSLRARM